MPGNDSRQKERATAPGRMLRTAALLGGFTLLSRLLGLVRDMGMAWLLGGGAAADALVAAMRLPHVLRRLLGEGSLSMTLTAALVRRASAPSGKGAEGWAAQCGMLRPLASALALRLGLTLTVLTMLGLLAAPLLASLLAPGFSRPESARVAELLRICLPYLLTAGMAALGMAFLNSMDVFWLPALSPALFNLTMLLFTVAASLGGWPPAQTLALGMCCGGLVQWLAQWLALRRLLPKAAPAADGRGAVAVDAGGGSAGRIAWRCLAQAPAGLLGAAAPQLAMLAAMCMASGLGRGHVAALYYAERLLELPLGLVGVCLGMASLPSLSRLAVERNFAAFGDQLRAALRWTALFSLPAAAGLWAVGPELVEALLRRGAFDALAAREAGQALWAYLPGLPAFALNRSLLAGCNALGATRRTAVSACWAVAATLAVGAVLGHSLPTAWSVMGPALAVSLGLWLQTCLLWFGLCRALRDRGQNAGAMPWRTLFQQALAALAAGLAAWAALAARAAFPEGWWGGVWSALALAVAAGLAAWLLCLAALGNKDLAVLTGRLREMK
ncbi:murein biosynthesis integral membrane protein MurJ [Desulfovibrio sp. SGI.169]|uniref:murein biosynthesis integral membrane protein MurJ n=1 Tax=Desulfovibrio sp. SGI.169 TaxID=3420561 RepID=UPI003D093C20